jgi:ubiquinone/menaquinone biosynthesis C-methylase UbiE
MNQYSGLANYYDLIMTSGYYDYPMIASRAEKILRDRARILEIGVGTGLLADRLTADRPDREFTGVDFTPAMLDIARQRLGNRRGRNPPRVGGAARKSGVRARKSGVSSSFLPEKMNRHRISPE